MTLYLCVATPINFLGQKPTMTAALASHIRNLASFSILQTLPYSRPESRSAPSQNDDTGYSGMVASISLTALLIPVAFMSLLVKFTQVDFMCKKLYWHWSVGEWFQ